MSLKLYFHPLASFCQKVLIALYENDTPFEPHIVDLADETARADFEKLWPIGKFPVLRDEAKARTIPESSIIIEYLDLYYPGKTRLVPVDTELTLRTRQWDRFYDLYVDTPMQKVVTDRLRPADKNDPHGVAEAKTQLQIAYGMIEQEMEVKTWAMGDAFSMADCVAAPALFYANLITPFDDTHKHTAAYLGRLMKRPSFAQVVMEAQPYFAMFPEK
ncbi:MAG: glutathione S-transferase family protein [Gammaproteobacteria bacterium]|nr:glutathione S-transferase family protein [Gammaproteobacteria bacterium]MBA3732328.1 glutathione S-transferase family protein [Gammaproteobacteria bacterium]